MHDRAQQTENQEKLPKVEPNLNKKQVTEAVKAVLTLAKQMAESKKELFEGEQLPILLQVSSIKIPKVPTRQLRITLPHTLVSDTDDVVLFVQDLQKGRGKDYEPTKEHYQDLLRQHGCTCVKDVIPLNQVKTEFGQYETKRKLLSSYDHFLTDGRIAGHLSHMLGGMFKKKRKLPTWVRMDSKDLKHEIEHALKKTIMPLHSHGTTYSLQVGHSSMSETNIYENIVSLCDCLAMHYPGGWMNIRSLILKTPTSLPVPIYVSLKNKREVKVPVAKAKRPKAYQTYEGELSTLSGNASVRVMPDGTVTMTRKRASKDGKTLTSSDKPAVKKIKLRKNISKEKLPSVQKEEVLSPVDSEDEIADVEESYLSQWQQQNANSLEEEHIPEPSKKIKNKAQKKLVAGKKQAKSKVVVSSKPSQELPGIVKEKKQKGVAQTALLNTKKQKTNPETKKPKEQSKEAKQKVLAEAKGKKSKIVESNVTEKKITRQNNTQKSAKDLKNVKTTASLNIPDTNSKIKLSRKEELIKEYLQAQKNLQPQNKVMNKKVVPNVISEKPKKSKMKLKSIKRLQK